MCFCHNSPCLQPTAVWPTITAMGRCQTRTSEGSLKHRAVYQMTIGVNEGTKMASVTSTKRSRLAQKSRKKSRRRTRSQATGIPRDLACPTVPAACLRIVITFVISVPPAREPLRMRPREPSRMRTMVEVCSCHDTTRAGCLGPVQRGRQSCAQCLVCAGIVRKREGRE